MSEFHKGDQFFTSLNPERTVDFKGDINTSLHFQSIGSIESQSIEAPITVTATGAQTATLVRGNMFVQEIWLTQPDNGLRTIGPQFHVKYDKAYYPAPRVIVQDGIVNWDGVNYSPSYNVICSNTGYAVAYRSISANDHSINRQFFGMVIK